MIRRALVLVVFAACGGKLEPTSTQITPGNASAPSAPPSSATTCSTTPSQIYSGRPHAFAVDDAFIYIADDQSPLVRVTRAGGTPKQVVPSSPPSFAIGAGHVFYVNEDVDLIRFAVTDDSFQSPVSGSALTFDGTYVTSGDHRWSIDGAVRVDSPPPSGTKMLGVAETNGVVYAAFSNGANGTIARLPFDGSAPTTVLDDAGNLSAFGVDAQYLYCATTRSVAGPGIIRVGLDGSKPFVLSVPAPDAMAVDASGDSVYFIRENAVWKILKTGGIPHKLADTRGAGSILVQGDSVFWSSELGDPSFDSGVYSICK